MYSLFIGAHIFRGSFVFGPCFIVHYSVSSLVLHEIAFAHW